LRPIEATTGDDERRNRLLLRRASYAPSGGETFGTLSADMGEATSEVVERAGRCQWKHLCDAMSITTMTDRAGWEEEINKDVFGELMRQGGFRNESIYLQC